MASNSTLYKSLSVRIMKDLLRDIPSWSVNDAAACVGNAGHECGGFSTLQEIKPIVKNSRGGWGWFQWTGPRRKSFERFANSKNYLLDSYEANYGFLLYELKNTETSTIVKTKNAGYLKDKVVAFEMAFERAGVKHYDSRLTYARAALCYYVDAQNNTTTPLKSLQTVKKQETKMEKADLKVIARQSTNIVTSTVIPVAAALNGVDLKLIAVGCGLVIVCMAIWALYDWRQNKKTDK
jgi:Phage tail lysozyme